MFLKTFFKIFKILRNKMSLLPQILKSFKNKKKNTHILLFIFYIKSLLLLNKSIKSLFDHVFLKLVFKNCFLFLNLKMVFKNKFKKI